MRKIFALALLAAFAPLGVAHAATPKPMATSMPMKGKMGTMSMKGKTTKGKKSKMTKPKTMPMRDPKTGRFMKKPTPAPTAKK